MQPIPEKVGAVMHDTVVIVLVAVSRIGEALLVEIVEEF